MAVFLSASDENAGKDHRSMFFYGGLLAPVKDWMYLFTPAWQKQVLDGPPSIRLLHMVEIRSKDFRAKHGLSEKEAERRVDEAIRVVQSVNSLRPISSRMDAGSFLDKFPKKNKMRIASGARKRFMPDYIAFLGYVFTALGHVADHFPEAEKVDFLVERKDGITDHVNEFYDDIQASLTDCGESRMASLLGCLIPGDKDRLPLQVADLFCWHAHRREIGTLTEVDQKRYETFASRGGQRQHWEEGMLAKLREALEVRTK
jgi:hypothetical protein